MGPIGRAQITFALAAKAAGITDKQLRNWLDKGQVLLQGDDDRGEGQWRRFSLIDVVRLGIIGAIVRYGVKVTDAGDIIRDNVDSKLMTLAGHDNAPRQAISASMRGVTILISRDVADDVRMAVSLTYGPADSPKIEKYKHYALFDIGQIANEVLARLDDDENEDEAEAE